MRTRLVKTLSLGITACFLIIGCCSVFAEDAVQMDTYSLSNGTNYFLIPLKGEAVKSDAEYTDVAVLVDTSASQIGEEVRKAGQDAVQSLISNLPANARIQIFTVDGNTESLTGGFVPLKSPEVEKAMKSLKENTPLGAADLQKSLRAAGDSFDFLENANRSIVFIGRGVSTSAVLDEKAFGEVVKTLVLDRVPVSSFANGAVTNVEVLGALANQTGGYVVDPGIKNGSDAGKLLAQAASASVYWPTDAPKFSDNLTVFPNPVPPLRSDRETFIIGAKSGPMKDETITIPVEFNKDGAKDLVWKAAPAASNPKNEYLYKMVEKASKDQGLTLPIAGRLLLGNAEAGTTAILNDTKDLAKQALETGNPQQAAQLAKLAQAQAPENTDVNAILAKAMEESKAFEQAEQIQKISQPKPEPTLLDATETNVSLATAASRAHAKVLIDEARQIARTDPDTALQDIKLNIQKVKNDRVLSPKDRNAILNELTTTAQMLQKAKTDKERRDYIALRNQATAQERLKVIKENDINEQRLIELMKRFNSLVEQSQFVLAWEVAETAAAIAGENAPLPTQAALVVLARDAYVQNQDLRIRRRKGFLDVLMSVERSHIPIADEPPIVYPDPETWLALKKTRKEKYSDTALFTESDQARKIAKALDSITDVEGGEDKEETVESWLEKIKKQFGINIVFDKANIEETTGNSVNALKIDQPLLGVSLRSALRHVLRPHELGFSILDDALYITTQDQLKNNPQISTSLRLYSIQDLIAPPQQSMMGGGMMGGMGGGAFFAPPEVPNARALQNKGNSIMKDFLQKPALNPAKGIFYLDASEDLPQNSSAQPPVSLNEKWDRYLEANKIAKPVLEQGTSPEITAKNEKIMKQYQNDLLRFNNDLMLKVKNFCDAKNYDEAKALLHSCIRNNAAASWVYEALVLVLLQSNAPQKEVEKAILSTADFGADPVSMLGIAAYLEKMGMKKRALELYHEISKAIPTRPEPYVRGLDLSRQLNDENAQKWVVLGIASQAWEGKLVEDVWQNGMDLGKQLTEKMIAEGRTEEAAEFEKELAAALIRDVVVEVSWTGDAEIDVAVQEPTHSVCWFAQPRTTSGGILKKDPFVLSKSYDTQKEGQRIRVYTCPMGFDGEYTVLVSKSWGTLPQNKVGVRITTNAGSVKEHSAFYTVPLKEDKACFGIILEGGRRKEELKQEILTADALVNQMAIHNQRVLTQKVDQFKDNQAAGSARNANQSLVASKDGNYQSSYKYQPADTAAPSGKNAGYSMPEVQYAGDAGYMPVISFYNVGAGMMLQPNSLVPMDSRTYVRFTNDTMFTGLFKMFTYTVAGGAMNDVSGGMGGGGMGGGRGGGMGG
ncbi:MAG: hypothetical protein Q4G69_04640, partial [Planctomycetia bacterium]|nr:hypothetical protein [Planctomycetia bacterium]